MKHPKWLSLALGASAFSFVAGACVQRASAPQSGLEQPAQAQTQDRFEVPEPDRDLREAAEQNGAAPIRNVDDLAALSSTYAQISRKTTPAVVNIQAETVVPGRTLRDPFGGLFGEGSGERLFREPDQRSESVGSGVIVDARGLIITNNHVVGNATKMTVTLPDKRRFAARLLGADAASDVAMLKIEGTNLPTLKWADSDKLSVGDIVLAVGSPFNLSSTVTQGIISAKGRRDLGISAYEDFLQTDAAINPGNSGGALVDIQGNLVGINTAILSRSGGNQGIGLAIPSNLARSIGNQLASTGRVTRGWLGAVVQPLTADVAEQIGVGDQGGVVVTGVYSNSPAGQIPWSERGTDIILSVNGQSVASPGELRNLIAGAAPGTELRLKVWQDGKIREFSPQAGRRPPRAQGV